jgi:hypothetical protein
LRTPRRHAAGSANALALATSACSKTYTEIEVRDSGKVAVGLWNGSSALTALPADGSQRVVPLPVPGVAAMRHGREIALGWEGRPPVSLVDERGVLPRTVSNPGIEVRGRTLWAAYNVTPTRTLPQHLAAEDSVPIFLSTDMSNVVDARQVKEVRHWPAYVCLPLGALFTVLGTSLLASNDSSSKAGGVVYTAAAVPLLVYGVINLTSSNEVKPLDIAGATTR